MNLIRSFLFAPGSNPGVMAKALKAGADAVIFDLEDAVAISEKEAARELVCERVQTSAGRGRIYVRINAWNTSWCQEDLAAATAAGADGIMLPKAEDPAVVKDLAGLLPPGVDLIPLVETARGIMKAFDLAVCSDRISRLAFGAVDFTLDIGATYSKTGRELLYARSQLVVASRVADLFPPVDTVFPDLDNDPGLEAELVEVRQLGFFGKLAIHPRQLPLIHASFTPTEDEVAAAWKITRAFQESEQAGCAATRLDGEFIDYPVFLRARQILELAEYLRNLEP
jgi:citrate lyase subunit beta/citryl-CoA lyase